MKIQELEYYNDEYEWQLEPVKFLLNPNLPVGVWHWFTLMGKIDETS